MRTPITLVTALAATLLLVTSSNAQESMQPVETLTFQPQVRSNPTSRPTSRPNRSLSVTVDGEPVENPRYRSSEKRDDRRRDDDHRKARDRRIKAKIDSLDCEMQHAGPDWQITIEYEVEIEGLIGNDLYLLVLELVEDDRPVVDDNGAPLVMEIELLQPTDRDDDELEYEDRITATVPKVWIGDDDDLEIVAKLVRTSDGLLFDMEDESVDQERGRRVGVGVGVGWGVGCVGAGVGIGF